MNVDKIFAALTNELKSTKQIADELKINWYHAYAGLLELYYSGRVERIKTGRGLTLWRKNENKGENTTEAN